MIRSVYGRFCVRRRESVQVHADGGISFRVHGYFDIADSDASNVDNCTNAYPQHKNPCKFEQDMIIKDANQVPDLLLERDCKHSEFRRWESKRDKLEKKKQIGESKSLAVPFDTEASL